MKLNDQRLNQEHQLLVRKVADKANQCSKYHYPVYTDFLTPYEVDLSKAHLNTYNDIAYKVFGGYETAERQVIAIYPDYFEEKDIENPIGVLRVIVSSKQAELKHPDVLGAILGLGIKREKIGDLLVQKKQVDVIALKETCEYINLFLTKLGKYSASTSMINTDVLEVVEEAYEELRAVVSSMRLDVIMSAGFNMSRSKTAAIVKSKNVKVNYKEVVNNAIMIKENDLISCRGKGRLKVEKIVGETKKERMIITIHKYTKK